MEALKLNQAAVTLHLRIDKQGSSVWLDKHGGTGGFRTDKVKLNYPGEFLTSIHGYSGHLYGGGPLCVRSLTFVSNERTHGPFGVTLGTFFSLPMAGHKIVGFYGRVIFVNRIAKKLLGELLLPFANHMLESLPSLVFQKCPPLAINFPTQKFLQVTQKFLQV